MTGLKQFVYFHLQGSYSILAAFGELETQALQVDYAIWAAQKAVTKAKYEWEQAFTLMKELKLKPPLLTFRAWIWATGTTVMHISHACVWINVWINKHTWVPNLSSRVST
ncbi:hypothetical protein GOBAR_AA20556 [Gossypium barbadense]|uniref:Protein SET DOMAIN GROUP 40-like n=1 Tax=Gossypium barbadense TaxID=3634 RepID=A0A2P5X9U3_GOSBA|nr:hypothetical protein GOBAR_AA20556 [Gossypium barbadense]